MMKRSSPKRKSDAVAQVPLPVLDGSLFIPGDRVAVAVSGGADSTALLRVLLARREELGLVLSVIHVEHGLRGDASKQDAEFVAALAAELDVPCETIAVDTRRRVAATGESVEEAARNLRYRAFRDLLSSGKAEKVATAHTLDDQAETVLMKLLRGAWTEGLSGIYPVVRLDDSGKPMPPNDVRAGGLCVRPFLGARRAEIETYLRALGQAWCEDETNRSSDYLRNRIRHALLPTLAEYNPQIVKILAHLAENARAEEEHWQKEMARWLPQLLMPGRPTRGGGRRVAIAPGASAVAIDLARLRALDGGLRRRVLRAAAEGCGAMLDFEATEALLQMVAERGHSGSLSGVRPSQSGRRIDLGRGVRAEVSPRELRIEKDAATDDSPEYELPVPGEVDASVFGSRFTARLADSNHDSLPPAQVRAWRPGDWAELPGLHGPRKIKEVLDRLGVRGKDRRSWPVVEWQGRIIWMRGAGLVSKSEPNSTVGVSSTQNRGYRELYPLEGVRIEETPLISGESDRGNQES